MATESSVRRASTASRKADTVEVGAEETGKADTVQGGGDRLRPGLVEWKIKLMASDPYNSGETTKQDKEQSANISGRWC